MLSLSRKSSAVLRASRRRQLFQKDLLRSSTSLSSVVVARRGDDNGTANESTVDSYSRADIWKLRQAQRDFPSISAQNVAVNSLANRNEDDERLKLPKHGLLGRSKSTSLSFLDDTLYSTLIPSRSMPVYEGSISTESRAAAWRSLSAASSGVYQSGLLHKSLAPALSFAAQQQQYLFFSTDAEQKSPKKLPSRTLGTTRIPTPPSAPPVESNPLESLRKETPKSVLRKGVDLTVSIFRVVVEFLLKLPGNLVYYMTHGDERRQKIADLKQAAQDELHHYWMGSKLLWADIRTARSLLGKTLRGSALTRRERKQLLRTVSDIFRIVPFSMFVIIPFMEFALPFALRIFPNLLPSTFQDSLKAEENMKRELQSRIAMAHFFQETLEELAKEQKRKASKRKKELEEAGVDMKEDGTIKEQEDSARSMLMFLEKAQNGEMMPPEVIIRYANYFQDDLTLDNMPRMQLVNMCTYMAIPPYGSDSFLRFQLRHKIRVLKEDDQRILWEGIDSLTKMELREACQERGMRSVGLSKEAYKRALQQWLDLSVHKNVPISLLIMSRTFFLREEMFEKPAEDDSKSLSGLADAISGMDKEVLNEVILEVATSQEKLSDPEIRKLKLEVVSQQNELIRQEEAAREAAAKRKEAAEKEKAESAVVEDLSTAESIPSIDETAAQPPPASSVASEAVPEKESLLDTKQEGETEEESNLSTEEMDALSQLVSEDPVSKERAELERIKAAMKGEEENITKQGDTLKEGPEEMYHEEEKEEISPGPVSSSAEPMTSEEVDRYVASTVEKLDEQALSEAQISTKMTPDGVSSQETAERSTEEEESVAEESRDPIVDRLKKRVESMVDRIEVQLSDVEVKIGDKLHMLDKDRDGILTRDEVAKVLQQVLKRKISNDEATEIASEMDKNHDGLLTVDDLLKWCDEHRLIKLMEAGRDADMDRIIESHSPEHKDESQPKETKADKK